MIAKVFALFYFSINAGSVCSTIVTPLLREHTSYTIAFAVPAGLLMVATAIFWIGKPTYRMVSMCGFATYW
jgi:dipeptide/tripeptide permease